jgi:phosphoribosylamine--glycine ligase
MRILVVGGGGREHALCWAIAASPLTTKLCCAPGNAGIAEEAECVAIAADDIEGLTRFAVEQKIDFVVVGPEAPLVLGLVDRLSRAGIKAFGPTAAAAALEGSKGFMKDLCAKHQIPTAAYARFTEPGPAKAYVAGHALPVVVKADGSCRGVVGIAETLAEATAAIDSIRPTGLGEAGQAGDRAFLEGRSSSFFAPWPARSPSSSPPPRIAARRRQRPRPQYRRHGRLAPGPGGDGGAGSRIIGIIQPTAPVAGGGPHGPSCQAG